MKFVDYIGDVGAQLEISDIPAPKATFESAEEAVQLSLDWEEEVTRQIYAIVDIAKKDSNYMAQRFMDWFVEEQREEVSTMGTLLGMVRRAGESGMLFVEQFLARGGLAVHEGQGEG